MLVIDFIDVMIRGNVRLPPAWQPAVVAIPPAKAK